MGKLMTSLRLLKEKRSEFFASLLTGYFKGLPERLYLKMLYRCKMGHKLDLNNPTTFTEKIQWLKLYDRKPEYTVMVDKEAVKKFVAERIGDAYIIPTIGVWDHAEDIDWDELPAQFVLKTTHGGGGGGVVICKDKETFDKEKATARLNNSLSKDIYSVFKEWPYKDVRRRIIAEQYLSDLSTTGQVNDYKLFCFNGKVRFLKVDFDRFTKHGANYYDLDWNIMVVEETGIPSDFSREIPKPEKLREMIRIAETLSKGIPFLRVDLYYVNGKIYFGELTFFPSSGLVPFLPSECDAKIGAMLKLPK